MFISKTEFLERIGQTNIESVLAAAKQSVQIEAWLIRFNAAKDDPGVDLLYPETEKGLRALETAGILTAGTADRVLGVGGAPTKPTYVRVLAPFDTAWPDTYQVLSQSEVFWTIEGGIDFAPEYLEIAK